MQQRKLYNNFNNANYFVCDSVCVQYLLDERLQRVKPLCYPPANLIRGKFSFTGVVSVTLNFHPQGRKENGVTCTNEGKSSECLF